MTRPTCDPAENDRLPFGITPKGIVMVILFAGCALLFAFVFVLMFFDAAYIQAGGVQ